MKLYIGLWFAQRSMTLNDLEQSKNIKHNHGLPKCSSLGAQRSAYISSSEEVFSPTYVQQWLAL